MIKKELYCQILIQFFLLLNLSLMYCQNTDGENLSYAVWVHEYKKGWIDSENYYWILESPSEIDFDFLNKSFNSTFLFIGYKHDVQLCCNNYKDISLKFNNEFDFFNQKESFRIKVGDVTLRVLALKKTSCVCSTLTINKYSGIDTPKKVITLLTADFSKIPRKLKKNLNRNKLEWIEYFKNID